MIRVGPSSLFSSSLNQFHSTSAQTTGFYTNGMTAEPPPPSFPLGVVGWDIGPQVGLDPVYDRNFIFCHLPDPYVFPDDETSVSAVYLTVTAVSNGFTIVKSSGYAAVIRSAWPRADGVVSEDLRPLSLDQVAYARLDDVTPSARTYTWYNGASGSTPARDIIAVASDAGTFNTSTKVCTPLAGQTIDIKGIQFNNTSTKTQYLLGRSSYTASNTSYTSWGGSQLGTGNSGFRVIVITRGKNPVY